jgi:DNA helicase HerA-like ATPase
VVVDEAHVFCPQVGEAESAGAVIDLATRGRKRGFCAVLATQRLSKLHKDAAAECNNKLIGRTGLDVDVKRAADELGLGKDRWRELRDLDAGEFFAFGPAISREVVKVKIGPSRRGTRRPGRG